MPFYVYQSIRQVPKVSINLAGLTAVNQSGRCHSCQSIRQVSKVSIRQVSMVSQMSINQACVTDIRQLFTVTLQPGFLSVSAMTLVLNSASFTLPKAREQRKIMDSHHRYCSNSKPTHNSPLSHCWWWWCGGVDPIPCVSTHRISDPSSGPAKLLPHGVRPQIPDH